MPTPRQGYTNALGEPIPGCTTVLYALSTGPNDPLLYWAAGLAKRGLDWKNERQRAADVGTFCHDVIERFPDPLPARPVWMSNEEWDKAVKAYTAYADWHLAVSPEVVAKEVHLVSEKHQAGGTFDVIYRIGGRTLIADHKTGKTIDKPRVAAQMGFYADMARERGLVEDIQGGLILHYTAKGLRPVELNTDELAHGLELFKCARHAYTLLKTYPRG